MTDEELIARLREIQGQAGLFASAAADRIEALVKEKGYALNRIMELDDRAERLEAALRLLHDNVVLAFPTLADLGPVANARAALKGDDHE